MNLSVLSHHLGVLVALLGLTLLLLQPICDAHGLPLGAAHAGGVADAACCDELESGAAAVSAKAMSGSRKPVALEPAALAGVLLVLAFVTPAFVFLPRVASPNAPPLPLPGYYARSARILR